jgi:FKBP-type peptidyl-prolyl cis-trans isomerase
MVTLAFMLVCLTGQTTPPQDKPTPPVPKLISTDITVGTGDEIVRGDLVTVDYTGKLADGKVFDTSKKEGGKPFSLVVGIGEVIKGWDQGLIGMKAGGVRKLVIPPELAYGKRGSPGVIPADATLTFTISVNKIDHAAKRLKIEITKAGSGSELKWEDNATLRTTWKTVDGKMVVNTDKFPDGVPFNVGVTRILPGFTLGVIGMKPGEKRTITIPGDLAFGSAGQASLGVKPDAPIVAEVELISIAPAADASGGKDKRN